MLRGSAVGNARTGLRIAWSSAQNRKDEAVGITPENSCTKKVRHAEAHSARNALKTMPVHGNIRGNLHVYKCHFCDGFHVGTKKSGRIPAWALGR